MPAVRQPVIFVPHGGGPCFWMDLPPPFGPHAWDSLRDYLAGVLKSLPERPKAFLVVTAHWEADKPTVSVNPKPGMLYDYYGFPPHTYKLSYPAPGDPALAAEVKRLIEAAGLPVATDGERGFDHGVFVPFLIVDPKAEIPVVMLSLRKDLDPAFHIKLGKALEPLRDQGVAIVGSGMSFHDLRISATATRARRPRSTPGSTRRRKRRKRSARRGSRNGTRRRRRASAIRARSTFCR